jgi:hypothetical protein
VSLTPKNWKDFQHYKDRSPSWIKLHKGLLTDFAFNRLPLASRALAPMLWLLASEYDGGCITASTEEIAFRLHVSEAELLDALSPLVDAGFFIASEPLAKPEQSACLEKEDIGNIDQTEKEATASAAPADPSIPERDYFERGRKVLGPKSGAMIANLLKAKGRNVALARAALEEASQKQKPMEYVAAICRGPPAVRATTVYQQRQAEGREILNEIDQSISRRSGTADFVALRHDTSDGRPPVRSGAGSTVIDIPAKSH